jgi:hypothetical protein
MPKTSVCRISEWPLAGIEKTQLFVSSNNEVFCIAPSTYWNTSPGGLLAASGMADWMADRSSLKSLQSLGLILPGKLCSMVTLTSGPIRRAQTAKKVAGWVLAV